MAKDKVTRQQRENAFEALRMWETVPPGNVARLLHSWSYSAAEGKPPTCKTLCCFGGWVAWWPKFREQGVSALWGGMPAIIRGSSRLVGTEVALVLFGKRELFNPRCIGERGTDHEVVEKRLRDWIANTEVAD